MRRAGHADGEALFEAILRGRSGVTFTLDEEGGSWAYVRHADRKIHLHIPELAEELHTLVGSRLEITTPEFPIVLAAGERRAFTANTILRDPAWRRRDSQGALRISTADAVRLGLGDGDRATVTTRKGSVDAVVEVSDRMQAGHASLPNGLGLRDTAAGRPHGVAPNELTDLRHRDRFAGTPWHKHVLARIEKSAAGP